jgi:hypothetical protein
MSMNLYVEATRKATVKVKGKRKIITDRVSFGLWQTPTKVTYEILPLPTLEQKVEAYIKWADSVSTPYEDNIYDYNGELDENFEYPVIGRKTVHPAQDHAKELRDWLKMCDDEDYSVNFYTV